jgi:beta-phosphoglucomutase-like phosphatase (HAD superfamily)
MKLKLPAGDFRAYLFDCDGTIADSMPLHYIAWKTALAEWGCDFDEKLFYSWGGKPTRQIVSDLNTMNGLKMPIEAVAHHKEELYYQLLPQLKPIPEVLELINAQHGRIPFAVVSGGRLDSVTRSLTVLGLMDKFDTIVGSDDYIHGKPRRTPRELPGFRRHQPRHSGRNRRGHGFRESPGTLGEKLKRKMAR